MLRGVSQLSVYHRTKGHEQLVNLFVCQEHCLQLLWMKVHLATAGAAHQQTNSELLPSHGLLLLIFCCATEYTT